MYCIRVKFCVKFFSLMKPMHVYDGLVFCVQILIISEFTFKSILLEHQCINKNIK